MRSGFYKLSSPIKQISKVSRSGLPNSGSTFCSELRVYRFNFTSKFLSLESGRLAHTNSKPQDLQINPSNQDASPGRKRKEKNSLRRVAVEAQRSRDAKDSGKSPNSPPQTTLKDVVAFCAAEEYDMDHVSRILDQLGSQQDPYGTNLYPQVIHLEVPTNSTNLDKGDTQTVGDLFVFPSGTVVGWGVPEGMLSTLVNKSLLPASQRPHLHQIEEEDLRFIEDPKKEYSSIKGDNIILGTKTSPLNADPKNPLNESRHSCRSLESESTINQNHKRDAVLTKIVFSSGLARSTKLAVLESQLNDYFETTKSMLNILARGGRLRKSRSFVLSKTGQLLNIRAQLNLYSELTDSLPDVFWDSRSELGLEGYYDQVGKALDTNIRVKELNEKMNYAQEIADVLRETLNERHGVRLEWIIIILIAVEICFNILHEYRYYYGQRLATAKEDERTRSNES